MLFFQRMSRRYEQAATMLTSNKRFEEWGEIFGDEVTAAALIDRLLHHCYVGQLLPHAPAHRAVEDLHAADGPHTATPPSRPTRRKEDRAH